MSSPSPKAALFAQFAEVAKALGHAHRLVILELLAQRERSVEDLATASRLSLANASQHLRLMRQAGLLVSRRDGKQILYRLSDPAVLDLIAALHRVGERNMAEVREIVGGYFRERDSRSRSRARSWPPDEGRAGDRSRRPAGRRIRGRPFAACDQYAATRTRRAIAPAAEGPRDRRLLPRSTIASSPSKRWRCCARMASRPAVWRTDFRNGKRRACRSRDRLFARSA